MYLVLDGRVKILSPDATGQERVLAFLEQGAEIYTEKAVAAE